jgi:hypothetical protein
VAMMVAMVMQVGGGAPSVSEGGQGLRGAAAREVDGRGEQEWGLITPCPPPPVITGIGFGDGSGCGDGEVGSCVGVYIQ